MKNVIEVCPQTRRVRRVTRTINFEEHQLETLERLAQEQRRSVSFLVRDAMEAYLFPVQQSQPKD